MRLIGRLFPVGSLLYCTDAFHLSISCEILHVGVSLPALATWRSMHVTGEQLGQLTGIAAVLRFPLPEIEEDDDESSDEVQYCIVRTLWCFAWSAGWGETCVFYLCMSYCCCLHLQTGSKSTWENGVYWHNTRGMSCCLPPTSAERSNRHIIHGHVQELDLCMPELNLQTPRSTCLIGFYSKKSDPAVLLAC